MWKVLDTGPASSELAVRGNRTSDTPVYICQPGLPDWTRLTALIRECIFYEIYLAVLITMTTDMEDVGDMEDMGTMKVAQRNEGYAGQMQLMNIDIRSRVPPNISGVSSSPEIITAALNAAVTLECRAAGTPTPQLTWLKDGLPLPISSHVRLLLAGHILRIAQIQISDTGTYTCVAESMWSHEKKLQLSSVDMSDSGWYSCIAVNEAGKATRHFNLVVM
eukprot:g43300.t1